MTVEIKVPAMGESVTEATISKWFKKEGDAVKRDEPLLELETDKVTVEVPSPADGAIESISAQAGATVHGGRAAGRHRRRRRRRQGRRARQEGRSAQSRSTQACCSPPAPLPKPMPPPCRRPSASPPKAASPPPPSPAPARMAASPRATCWARWRRARQRPRRAPAAPAGPRHNEAREEKVPMTRLRKTIALRLKESQNTAAMLTTFNEVDMTAVMGLRTHLQGCVREEARREDGLHGLLHQGGGRGAEGAAQHQCRDRRRQHHLQELLRHRHRGLDRARPGGAGGERCRSAVAGRHRKGHRRFRRARPRQQAEDRGIAGRHLLHHQWRRLRLADVDARS